MAFTPLSIQEKMLIPIKSTAELAEQGTADCAALKLADRYKNSFMFVEVSIDGNPRTLMISKKGYPGTEGRSLDIVVGTKTGLAHLKIASGKARPDQILSDQNVTAIINHVDRHVKEQKEAISFEDSYLNHQTDIVIKPVMGTPLNEEANATLYDIYSQSSESLALVRKICENSAETKREDPFDFSTL